MCSTLLAMSKYPCTVNTAKDGMKQLLIARSDHTYTCLSCGFMLVASPKDASLIYCPNPNCGNHLVEIARPDLILCPVVSVPVEAAQNAE